GVVPVKAGEGGGKACGEADAVVGFCTADLVKAGKQLRWIQSEHAGNDQEITPELANSKIVLTNTARIHGPNTADQALALLLALTRGLAPELHEQKHPAGKTEWDWLKENAKPEELNGKTMLVVGLGGIGTQVARRAQAFGMRVLAIDPKDMER